MENKLNIGTKEERLAELKGLMSRYSSGELEKPIATPYVNNHVHTIYSFSPYSPSGAVYAAWKSGLPTVGIVDHDSAAGAKEFIEAGKIVGVEVTCGIECRCSAVGTPFEGKRINNPDQKSVAYLIAHGIPHQNIDKLQEWLTPYRANREKRNRKMVEKINEILKGTKVSLDYDKDVRSISMAKDGGSVTERHVLFSLAGKMIEEYGKGKTMVAFLEKELGLVPEGKVREQLLDKEDNMYEYYLLGLLKSSLVEKFYVDAADEMPTIAEFVTFITSIGGIPTYPYLGDVGSSVTGDKKTQTFEDEYLDQLVEWVADNGFFALAFMPTRNTGQQLERLMNLCKKHKLFQISGEDINTPFQSFICKALDEPEYKHLIDSTWALIGHEKEATKDITKGMFSPETLKAMPELSERIKYFMLKGKEKL